MDITWSNKRMGIWQSNRIELPRPLGRALDAYEINAHAGVAGYERDEINLFANRNDDESGWEWHVSFHRGGFSEMHEVAHGGGAGTTLDAAQRAAVITALLAMPELTAETPTRRPSRYGWASTSAIVYVRVDLGTKEIDRVRMVASQGPIKFVGFGERPNAEAIARDLSSPAAGEVVAIATENTWAPLGDLPASITWEG